ncbi:hypothetical protein [Sphingomonas ginsengisoli (ex An et al. 2013)]
MKTVDEMLATSSQMR